MRVPQKYLEQRPVVGRTVGGARRVGGRVQEHPSGPRRDGRLQLLRRQAEAGRGVAGDQNGLALADLDNVRIGGPIGRRNDDLVARIERRHHGVEEDLLGAGRDRDLVQLVGQRVLALEFLADRLLQFRRAVECGVFRFAAVDRIRGGLLHVFRRVEIRLTGAEDDHRLAFALHGGGAGADLQDFRNADRGNPRGGLKARLLDRCIDGHGRSCSIIRCRKRRPAPAAEPSNSSPCWWRAAYRPSRRRSRIRGRRRSPFRRRTRHRSRRRRSRY
jgi:hypothetical protein